MHKGAEHLFLTDDTLTKGVELRCAVSNLLMGGLWFVDQVLAVGQIAANLLADHHR